MNLSEFLAITSNLLKGWENPHAQGVIGFGFAFRWLKKLALVFLSTK